VVKKKTNSDLLDKFNQVENELKVSDEKFSINFEKITQLQSKPDVVNSSYLKTLKLMLVLLRVAFNFLRINLLMFNSILKRSFKFLSKANGALEKNLNENIHILNQKISLRTDQFQNFNRNHNDDEKKILSLLNANFKNSNITFENKLELRFEENIIILKNIQDTLGVINKNITNKGMDQSVEMVKLEICQIGMDVHYILTFTVSHLPYKWSKFFFKFVSHEMHESLSLINSTSTYELLSNATLGIDYFLIKINAGNLKSILQKINQRNSKINKFSSSLFEVGPQ